MTKDNKKDVNKNSPYGFLFDMINTKNEVKLIFRGLDGFSDITGKVIGFDNYNILLEVKGKRNLISRHSIVNIIEQ